MKRVMPWKFNIKGNEDIENVNFNIHPHYETGLPHHGFELLNPTSEIGKKAKNEYVQALKNALKPQTESVSI
ncbi:hypothetical protein [Neobacillus sp. DY30]|uniref:hypothetical protein n=1 Tax=Neobacillus sp. DY30 TaxID=3047871 RepID=UPI0024C0D6F1|nr:hypothetical protein [Neobacillus sp. DY30]WHY03103.1 hypothetical protein QNH29_13170 [Neobacillus sp. DY30]